MPKKKWFWNDITDAALTSASGGYDPTVRGRSQEFAERLGVPRWAVNRRARGRPSSVKAAIQRSRSAPSYTRARTSAGIGPHDGNIVSVLPPSG